MTTSFNVRLFLNARSRFDSVWKFARWRSPLTKAPVSIPAKNKGMPAETAIVLTNKFSSPVMNHTTPAPARIISPLAKYLNKEPPPLLFLRITCSSRFILQNSVKCPGKDNGRKVETSVHPVETRHVLHSHKSPPRSPCFSPGNVKGGC